MLEVGQKAPGLGIQNQNEEIVEIDQFKGKWLVLYFYPRDNTPGCTIEAKDFTCLVDEFKDLDAEVVGVSKDSIKSHNNFITKQELGINLLSDVDLNVMKSYDVWRLKKMYGKESMGVVRSTFIIDPDGKIAAVWNNVRAKGHADKVLEKLKELKSK